MNDAYRQFFLKNEHGQEFLKQLETLIDENHRKAEMVPENARDFTQRAAGVREVIQIIQSAVATTNREKRIPKQ